MSLTSFRGLLRIHFLPGTVVLATFFLASSGSAANDATYRCTDRHGKTLLGSGPPSDECASNICTFTNGIRKCDHEPADESPAMVPSPLAEANHQKWLGAIALLDRYPTEERIEQDRKAELQPVRHRLADADQRLKRALKERQGPIQDELDFHLRGPVPMELDERLKSNALAEAEAKLALSKAREEEEQINLRYDDYVKRFRVLMKRIHRRN